MNRKENWDEAPQKGGAKWRKVMVKYGKMMKTTQFQRISKVFIGSEVFRATLEPEEAKKVMNDTGFLQSLKEYDKDALAGNVKLTQKLQKYVGRPRETQPEWLI